MSIEKSTNIFVSPLGNDENNGTECAPFKTIDRAKKEAQKRIITAQNDIIISLCDGTYFLNEPIVFTSVDSGLNNNYIRYEAAENAKPIISGGFRVENLVHTENGLWKANLCSEGNIRQLFVNGKPANCASSKKMITPLGWCYKDNKVVGIYVKKTEVGLLKNASNISLHWSRGWKTIVCNVDDIVPYDEEKNIIYLYGNDFQKALTVAHKICDDTPFYIENAKEYVTHEGDFYYDTQEQVLYYKPFENEKIEQTDMYVPTLEKLIILKGTAEEYVHNISFSGIVFAHTTWKRTDKYGYIGGQAQYIQPYNRTSKEYFDNWFVSAAVSMDFCNNIIFKKNCFTDLASVAFGMYNGIENATIEENIFCYIGGGAISVGLPIHNYNINPLDGCDLALFKPTSASSEGKGNESSNVNKDDPAYSKWCGDANSWWQVDLLDEYKIDRIEIRANERTDNEYQRKGFKVLASKGEDFSHCVCLYDFPETMKPFDYKSIYNINVHSEEQYRYVRIVRTSNKDFVLNDVKVINENIKPKIYKKSCRNILIHNNYITKIGEYLWDSPAIQAYYTDNLTVSHNTLFDLPYTGIGIGWGWDDFKDSTTCRNNKILYNHIENYTNICFDGAGIYLLGNQPDSYIVGNYLKGQANFPGAIYPDQGTAYYTIKNNVIEDTQTAFFLHQPSVHDIRVFNNYSTTIDYKCTGTNCTIEEPQFFVSGIYNKTIKDIIANSGLTNEYNNNLLEISKCSYNECEIDKYFNIINQKEYVSTECFMRDYIRVEFINAKKCLKMLSIKACLDDIKKIELLINNAEEFADDEEQKAFTKRNNSKTKTSFENRKELLLKVFDIKKSINQLIKKVGDEFVDE